MAYLTQNLFIFQENNLYKLLNTNLKASNSSTLKTNKISLKSYESCLDQRSWAYNDREKSDFLLDSVHKVDKLDSQQKKNANLHKVSAKILYYEYLHVLKLLNEQNQKIFHLNKQNMKLNMANDEFFMDAKDAIDTDKDRTVKKIELAEMMQENATLRQQIVEINEKLAKTEIELRNMDSIIEERDKLRIQMCAIYTQMEKKNGMTSFQNIHALKHNIYPQMSTLRDQISPMTERERDVTIKYHRLLESQIDYIRCQKQLILAEEAIQKYEEDITFYMKEIECQEDQISDKNELLRSAKSLICFLNSLVSKMLKEKCGKSEDG